MDEQKVRELLERAGKQYNDGRYAEAIASWQEVISQDPENQKAREGIRMAQLLVVNWETPAGEAEEGELSPAGADAETQGKIDIGIARVRELMASGRHQEALEGCQLLSELAPGMEKVRHLIEEVTQASEAQPFIRERLERARKLLAQGRSKEAAEEARNVLSVDRSNAEAQEILGRAGGPAQPAVKQATMSAFQVDKSGKNPPPSPFSSRAQTDALLAQFDFESETAPASPADTLKAPSVGPVTPVEQAVDAPGPDEDPFSLDLGATGASRPAAAGAASGSDAAASGADAEIRRIIEAGRKLQSQKRYQEAIAAWSRVFALDAANSEAGDLIDQAKLLIESQARQLDETFYRGVDSFESGRLEESKQVFEEILQVQGDHHEAKEYLSRIAEKQKARPATEIPPIPARRPTSPSPSAHAEESLASSSSVPLAVPNPRSVPFEASGAKHSMTPFPVKRKPVAPVTRGSGRRVMLAVVIFVLMGAGGWYFMMLGSEPQPLETVPAVPVPRAKAPQPPPASPEPAPDPKPEPSPAKAGGLEVVPGTVPAAAAARPEPPAPEPETNRRRLERLLSEGRSLYEEGRYAEAVARLEQAVKIDPTNFDVEDLRSKAAAAVSKETRFSKDLEAAKSAFADNDWQGALWKLYRLREGARDRSDLVRYIENANYNWGIESLGSFEIDNAIEHFKDALEMAPEDPQITRHLDVASRYKKRHRDPAFDAYVKSISPRQLEDQ